MDRERAVQLPWWQRAGSGPWTETVLYNFGASADIVSVTGLIFGADGALYGTTDTGGTSGLGVVFKLTPSSAAGGSWTETTLYNFGGSDGSFPNKGLTFGTDGALYGTT